MAFLDGEVSSDDEAHTDCPPSQPERDGRAAFLLDGELARQKAAQPCYMRTYGKYLTPAGNLVSAAAAAPKMNETRQKVLAKALRDKIGDEASGRAAAPPKKADGGDDRKKGKKKR